MLPKSLAPEPPPMLVTPTLTNDRPIIVTTVPVTTVGKNLNIFPYKGAMIKTIIAAAIIEP